jgi:hypothetical protein
MLAAHVVRFRQGREKQISLSIGGLDQRNRSPAFRAGEQLQQSDAAKLLAFLLAPAAKEILWRLFHNRRPARLSA